MLKSFVDRAPKFLNDALKPLKSDIVSIIETLSEMNNILLLADQRLHIESMNARSRIRSRYRTLPLLYGITLFGAQMCTYRSRVRKEERGEGASQHNCEWGS